MPLGVQMRLAQSEKQIEQWELRMPSMCSARGITKWDKATISRKLKEAGDRKSQVKNVIEQIVKIKNIIDQSLSSAIELSEHHEPFMKKGIISVTDKSNEGVIIWIGNLWSKL